MGRGISRARRSRFLTTAAVLAAAAVLLAAAGCAPVSKVPKVSKEATEAEAEKQRQLIVDDQIKLHARLANVAYPILEHNADLCGDDTKPSIHALFINKYSLGDEYEGTLAGRGIAETATIVALPDGSPLKAAGADVGDSIVAVGDWRVPKGKDAIEEVRDKIDEVGKTSDTIRLTLATPQGTREIESGVRTICDYKFGVVNSDQVNAFADGDNFAVTSGMMRFVDTDTELATIVGHEMAHNLMDHIEKWQGNALLGFIFDLLAAGVGVNTQGAFSKMAAQAYSQDFEREADYVGLYIMARAGYETEGTANLWRRMATTHPGSESMALASTHPATPERFLALEQTAGEIHAKIAAGAPLAFELKEDERGGRPKENPQAPWD